MKTLNSKAVTTLLTSLKTIRIIRIKTDRDRGTKLLRYIAGRTQSMVTLVQAPQEVPDFEPIQMPSNLDVSPAAGTKQKFDELGPEGFSKWLSDQNKYSLQIQHGVMLTNPYLLHVYVPSIWHA